jgi:hypothetical protein
MDDLNAENMLKRYGGKQTKLCDAIIQQEQECLGPYMHTLKVGHVQSFVFKPGDEGPFYLSTSERETKRNDIALEGTKKRILERQLALQGIEVQDTAK